MRGEGRGERGEERGEGRGRGGAYNVSHVSTTSKAAVGRGGGCAPTLLQSHATNEKVQQQLLLLLLLIAFIFSLTFSLVTRSSTSTLKSCEFGV